MGRHVLLLATLVAAMGCGDDNAATSHDAYNADTSSDTSDSAQSSLCVEGQLRCLDDSQPARCDGLGEPVALEACEDGEICRGGVCRAPICTPGEATCVGWRSTKRCGDSGLFYEAVSHCAETETCHEGACQVCVPGEPVCATMAAFATCDETGTSFPMEDITACEGITNCHEPTGLCLELSCSPGSSECAGGLGTHVCLESGTGFEPDVTPCAANERCEGGACIADDCTFEPVLFIVDRTDIVSEDWSAYRDAISEQVQAAQGSMFGFMPYPMNFGCPDGLADSPKEPIGSVDESDIEGWFSDTVSSAGEAPLESVFESVVHRVEEIFAGRPGRIILISAGRATCGTELSRLSNLVRTLRGDYGIETFVIGHRVTPTAVNPTLDAILKAGGSGWDDFERTYYASALSDAIERALIGLETCPSL